MLWVFCGIITCLIIIFEIWFLIKKRNHPLRIIIVLLGLIAATYSAYVPMFIHEHGLFSGLLGNFDNVLRVITVDADIIDCYDAVKEEIGTSLFADCYIFVLSFLHLALPAVSALTAVTIILRCYSLLQLFFANKSDKPIFVFSELNERSMQLARSLKKKKCVIVFAGSEKSSLDFKDSNSNNFIYRDDSISNIKIAINSKRDVYFFCISDDENEVLSLSLQLIDKYSKVDELKQERIHIFHFSKKSDSTVFIDSSSKGLLDVQCFNEYEIMVFQLLDRHPLFRYSDHGLRVLLYGFSPLSVIALKTIIWCGQLVDVPLKISVVGLNIYDQLEELKLKTPGLFSGRYNVAFYDCKSKHEMMEAVRKKCSDSNYVIVSCETDNDTMEAGIFLRRAFYMLDAKYENCPPIFCHINESSKSIILKELSTEETNAARKMSYDLIPFGSTEDVYSYGGIVGSSINSLAKNVHMAYEEIFSDGDIDVKDALRRFNTFEVNKRSNRANALHIRYKLNMLGLDYVPSDEATDYNMSFLGQDELLEKLAVSEHNRWMAFLEMEGWVPATKKQVLAYRKSGISKGRHNCPILKMHPYICKYEDLFDLSRDLEGKDTTVYDIELIRKIPDILGDKWDVTEKKYKIIPKNNQEN